MHELFKDGMVRTGGKINVMKVTAPMIKYEQW
jgi:hypothetical protein